MQFLVFRHNEHQMEDAKRLAKELGVDKLVLKTAQILHFEDGSELLPTQEKYSRYKKQKGGNYIRKKKVRNHCWRAFSSVVIAANGDVLPCSYDKNGEFAFGNINEESFPDIWKNEKSKAFKKQILTNRGEFPMCCNCTE
jgi:radical SAM protein with 4Fe4S-binding SPASM domain